MLQVSRFMEELLKPLINNQYFQVFSALVTFASALAAIIPTPKEGTGLAKIYKVIDFLALNILHAKETGKEK